ncbi:hypothetical protein BCR35DRAFT_310473 [Leucosporidium creatinivorum]|uniref:mRNA 3'-end-processing protein RNA14 n=1 Tax=Leucosporidium creatinivorum TaxID=106004 RepID=A0A1Y2D437_9BASI|nr:hypothetical protein BCR35DRAFT_310473 [Leucosporidium creatinivorum]
MSDVATPDPRRAATASATATPEVAAPPAAEEVVAPSVAAAAELAALGMGGAPSSSSLDASIAATLAMDPTASGDEPIAENVTSAEAAAAAAAEGLVKQEDEGDQVMGDETADPTLVAASASTTPLAAIIAGDESRVSSEQLEGTPVPDAPIESGKPIVKSKPTSSLSRVAQLTARVEKDPLDGEAQLALLQDAEQKGDLERTREVYENFLKVFPDAARQWIGYCDLELSHGLFERVQDIFIRCLRPSCSVELWKFYLDFVRRRNPIDLSQGEQAKAARATITKSFEFALNHVGQDRRAGDMWLEYLSFLKEGSNRGTWEDQQRMDALRKTYQRAVQIPLNNVEQIWQDYNQFENNMSKMTAKKFVGELSPAYMTARKVLRELRALYDGLAEPDLPFRPNWEEGDREALELWRKYLAYEESNPLDIEDPAVLQGRVSFAYKKAVAYLRFFSEAWYLAANYNIKLGNTDEATLLLHTGQVANPGSLLLGYTLAEIEEGRGEFETCYKTYDSLLEHFHRELAQLEAATKAEVAEAIEQFEAQAVVEGDDEETRQKTVQEKEEVKANIIKKHEGAVENAKRGAASVWITEMRFARRSEGVKQARSVFTKARKSRHLAWQVVEASATMEFFWNNDPKVATNVFELGLKTFSKEPEYVLQYLDYLIRTNNPNNARALFERTVALVEPEKAKPVWDRMAQYEYQYGDYLAAQKIFQRYSEAFPDASPIERFAQRHGAHGLEDAITRDLGLASRASSHRERRSYRSPSPSRKRNASVDPESALASAGGPERAEHGSKRFKPNPEGSPAPSSNGGDAPAGQRPWGQPPAATGAAPTDEVVRRRPLESTAAPALTKALPYMLDPRGDNIAVLPDAVVFFLSILPPAASFTGPAFDPATLVDIISTTLLPGTAPGPGLPGERLGIPPRPKPTGGSSNGASSAGAAAGYGGSERKPLSPQRPSGGSDYGYGRSSGGGGGRGGRRY